MTTRTQLQSMLRLPSIFDGRPPNFFGSTGYFPECDVIIGSLQHFPEYDVIRDNVKHFSGSDGEGGGSFYFT